MTKIFLCIAVLLFACVNQSFQENDVASVAEINVNVPISNTSKVIHVMVALCDNKYQGIVPVPKAIGNGQDPANNLYWGCAYGIKTFFKRSKQWALLKSVKSDSPIMERLVFKHKQYNYFLVADAYNGMYIKHCTDMFLKSLAGKTKDTLHVNGTVLGINGNAKLLSYIGHNGLMDFELPDDYKNTDDASRDAIMLACYSKNYFSRYVKSAKAAPLLWSTGLMAPEAYVLHDALQAYIAAEGNTAIKEKAAKAYAQYQKCSIKAARNLLVGGF
ncbi:MAG: hypothetical protein ACK5NK_12255 [Niabella sp.]